MAKVILEPIGSPREQLLGDEVWERQLRCMGELNDKLQGRRDEVRAGWGPKYVERVRAKGKMPTWEWLERLKDDDSPILPIGTLVNYGRTFGPEKRTSPGAGVVTAFLRVHGLWVVAIANDNTVASGSWWPQTPEKIERAQWMALKLRIPAICATPWPTTSTTSSSTPPPWTWSLALREPTRGQLSSSTPSWFGG